MKDLAAILTFFKLYLYFAREILVIY